VNQPTLQKTLQEKPLQHTRMDKFTRDNTSTDKDKAKASTPFPTEMSTPDNSKPTKRTESAAWFILTKVNTTANGLLGKNRVKACTFTQIKTCFQETGLMVKNMDPAPTCLVRPVWSTLENGMKTNSWREDGPIRMEHTLKESFKATNPKAMELGTSKMETRPMETMTK